MQGFTTLTGIPFSDLPAILDRELPSDAYKPVPGGADLTDIDPGHMRKVLNETFGLCGLGWGYAYRAEDLQFHTDVRESKYGDRTVIVATLSHLEFWYLAVAPDGSQLRCTVHASGSSENSNHAYAMKGAITSALGNASSNIGFQESVYLGQRSHKTVGKSKPAPKPPEAKAPALHTPVMAIPGKIIPGSNGHKPAVAAPAAVAELEDLDEPAETKPGDFIVPLGKNMGKKLSEVPRAWLEWAAREMQATTEQSRALKAAAQAYLAS